MRVERKCLICNQKYYHPDQDQHHEHGGQGRKSEHGAVEVASLSPIEIPKSPTQIQESPEKKIKIAEEVSEKSTVDKSLPKKNKKNLAKKVDKRSREYRQSIGR